MKSLIHWWTKNHIAANFLMWAIIVAGVLAWWRLKKEIFPEIQTNYISITVPYPNATPEEVEKGVVVPIEEAIQDLDGIKRLFSNSVESNGIIFVEVLEDHSVDVVINKIKARVDGIRNLAENAEEPIIEDIPLRSQILSIAVTAPTDEKGLRAVAEQLRDHLLALDEVSQVELAGVRKHEISIEVSERTLREHELTFDRVAQAVKSSSLDLPAGSVRTEAGEIIIRTQGKRYTAEEFGEVTVLTRPDGSKVPLREVAQVVDGFEEVDLFTRFDGRSAVVVNVFRSGEEDTLEVAKAAKEYLKKAPQSLPEGVQLEVWNDTSLLLQDRLSLMANDAISGFILVCIMLTLFLRPALAFHVALGIPIAFCGGLIFLPWLGISVNMISIFAFIVVLGIVTDDAIVVGENVYERMRKGEQAKLAAPRGAYEVMVVAIFGVLTVMVSFTPMLGISGISGKIWRNIPWVVIPVLFISLVETNLILPAHLAHLKPEKPDDQVGWFIRLQRRITRGVDVFIDHHYKRFIAGAIRSRYLTLAIFIAVAAVIVGLIIGGFIKSEFFPKVEGEIVSAKISLANGVPVEQTQEVVRRMEEKAGELNKIFARPDGQPVVLHMMATVGTQPFKIDFQPQSKSSASNIGEVTLQLMAAADRTVTSDTIVSKWRELVGPVPGAVELVFISNTQRTGNAFDLEFHGSDLGVLNEAVTHFKNELGKYRGVKDIADSNREGKREVKLTMTPQGESLNLRLSDVARQVRQGFYGEEVQRLQRGRDEVKVMVRYPREERRSQANLDGMKIRTPQGQEIPFSEVATAVASRGYSGIYRADRQRSIKVTADIDKSEPGANANAVVEELEARVFPEMRRLFPTIHWAFQGEQKDQRQSMKELQIGNVLCLLAIFVLLAIPLRSYVQPLIVMSVIPFGAVGAVIGHVVFGLELSIMSTIGIVALSGVVVNESLVLVEYVNRHRRSGSAVADAARDAGSARFQAIMLTSITSFIGVLPIITETSIQAKFLIPCGVSLAFGCLFNMVNTLILVPCVYAILEDVKALFFTKEKRTEWEAHEQEEAAERGLDWMESPGAAKSD